jgi:hypothetical protein
MALQAGVVELGPTLPSENGLHGCRDRKWDSALDCFAMDDEIEDSRGIDVAQIRRQLRMTVPERVRTMVDAANILTSIRANAQASLSRAE